jgi:predicted Zn-dependent protease
MSFNPLANKVNINEKKKIEAMLEVIHKATAKECSQHWRKHPPVYGWIQMNYPTAVQPSLVSKYEKAREKLDPLLREENLDCQTDPITADSIELAKFEEYCPGNPYRLDPEKVNEDVLKESKSVLKF